MAGVRLNVDAQLLVGARGAVGLAGRLEPGVGSRPAVWRKRDLRPIDPRKKRRPNPRRIANLRARVR